jgi:phosphatidylethanolamine-binding protein
LPPSIEKAFTENDIVADVLSGKGPYKFLELKFKGGLDVELGNQLTPTQASQQPQVDWDASADRLYTLAMVDPDAPSRANPVNR